MPPVTGGVACQPGVVEVKGAADHVAGSAAIGGGISQKRLFRVNFKRRNKSSAEVYAKARICYGCCMIQPEDLVGDEWAEWYRLTPVQRWLESEKLWQTYLALGGSLDPEPDTQSPFYDPQAPSPRPAHGGAGVRVSRRRRAKSRY